MDFYQIMECLPTVDDKKLKMAYLKAAKKYHPDVYKGVNANHFQKVSEAYNILKNAAKRKEYDRKMKIHKMRDNKGYKAYAQKMRQQGREFTHEMYADMKEKAK